jgi:hypothetical protein
MFFMIVEPFKNGDPKPIRERFISGGQMMPNDIVYHASWIDADNTRCFHALTATRRNSLKPVGTDRSLHH